MPVQDDGFMPITLEASVYDNQCKKTITSLHRLHDRLQAEVTHQRKSSRGSFIDRVEHNSSRSLNASSKRSSSKRTDSSPIYCWVILRRINLRIEKLKNLCQLVETKLIHLEGERDEAMARRMEEKDSHLHRSTERSVLGVQVSDRSEPSTSRHYLNEMLILNHVLRLAQLSVTDFERLEGQAMEILCAM
eukprot:GILI01029411.1.p1 GENE.GILI01029411.1~~GILI01029411.1.p1  ORF type:complete len:197 (-),score=11.60 GILI01029411.1:6-575(-)